MGFRIFIFFSGLELESELAKILFGVGFVMTNITMTYFYVALFHAWAKLYGNNYSTKKNVKFYFIIVYICFLIRIFLILLPYNHWFDYEPPLDFGFDFRIITAIPLYIIGFLTVGFMFKHSKTELQNPSNINPDWSRGNYNASICYIVSFICFSFTVFLVVYIPLMGLFMIPKTIAYLIALYYHYKYLLSK